MAKRLVAFFIMAFLFISSTGIDFAKAKNVFNDLGSVAWAQEAIYFLNDRGIINGYGNGKFGPNDNITREQAALMLVRELYPNETSTTKLPFLDVTKNSFYYNAIAVAVDHGLFEGYPNGTFKPKDPISRGAVAKIFALAYDLKGDKANFKDLNTAPWASEYIQALASNNIVNGYDDGTFRPNNTITRAEFSLSFARLLNDKFKPKTKDPESPKPETPEKPDPIHNELTTSQIIQLNDGKIVLLEVSGKNGRSQGSGVIVGEGLILTNEHVVAGANHIEVKLNDGTSYQVEGLVANDRKKDLALLKTNTRIKDVKPVKIGKLSDLNKGDKIVAIGSPLGLQNTASEGIVSSFRSIEGVQHIQISVPIDHGSSGGGLFNIKGELVGVTTSGYKSQANLNFAVAIDEASNWYKYFTMKYENIVADPIKIQPNLPDTDDTLPIPGFENIALGMTKEQVKRLETSTLFSEKQDSLLYRGKLVLGHSADITYSFKNNKLESISIFHDVVNNKYDLDLLEAYFYVMYDNLSIILGPAVYLDTNWFNDGREYVISAFWVNDGYDTLLTCVIQSDYSSFGGVHISIR